MKIRWHIPDKDHLVRYSFHERATHAIVAVNCVYLILSGLALHTPYLFWMASVLGGPAMMRYFHPLLGAIYFVSLVYMWWLWRKDLWVKEQDKEWMSKVEAYMTNHDDEMPPVDRWNPGQKIFFWIMAVSGVGLLLSGIVLWLPEFVPWKLQWLKFLAILHPCRLRLCQYWRIAHSRLYGHLPGERWFLADHHRRSYAPLGQASSPALVFTSDERAHRWLTLCSRSFARKRRDLSGRPTASGQKHSRRVCPTHS